MAETLQRILRQVQGEAGLRRRGARDQRSPHGEGHLPGVRHQDEPDPGQGLSRSPASDGRPGRPTPRVRRTARRSTVRTRGSVAPGLCTSVAGQRLVSATLTDPGATGPTSSSGRAGPDESELHDARQRQPIDVAGVYTLINGIAVIGRAQAPCRSAPNRRRPWCCTTPPPDAVSILRALDGTAPLGEVLAATGADPRSGRRCSDDLRDARLLVPVAQLVVPGLPGEPGLESERDSLVHRHGVAVGPPGPAGQAGRGRRRPGQRPRGDRGRRPRWRRPGSATSTSNRTGLSARPTCPAIRSRPAGRLGTGRFGRDRIGSARQVVARVAPYAGRHRQRRRDLRSASRRRVEGAPRRHAHHRVDLAVLAGDGPPPPSLAAELTAAARSPPGRSQPA